MNTSSHNSNGCMFIAQNGSRAEGARPTCSSLKHAVSEENFHFAAMTMSVQKQPCDGVTNDFLITSLQVARVQPWTAIPIATAWLATSPTVPSACLSVGQIMGGADVTRSAKFKRSNVKDGVTLTATSTVRILHLVS